MVSTDHFWGTVVPKTFLLTSAAARSMETLTEAILNFSGRIDLPITLETSHSLFNILWKYRVRVLFKEKGSRVNPKD